MQQFISHAWIVKQIYNKKHRMNRAPLYTNELEIGKRKSGEARSFMMTLSIKSATMDLERSDCRLNSTFIVYDKTL
jgi:hypothetical protein